MQALESYHWPGNIRELQNFIERAVIMTTGTVLQPRLAELRLRTVIEAMGEGVIVQDSEGTIIDCNPAACSILGVTREEVEALRVLGCQLFQGFFFARPLPVDKFVRKVVDAEGGYAGVAIAPGATLFTVMPSGPSSTARSRISMRSPPLLQQ